MNPESESESTGELDRLINEYLEGLSRGESPDRDRLLDGREHLSAGFERFLADYEGFGAVAGNRAESRGATLRAAPRPGTRLGEYEILEPIGGGGMGVVVKARHATLRRVVALKLIRAGASASTEDVERFRRETATVASLRHPHIVPLLEAGEIDGFRYFSMPYVEGAAPSSTSLSGDWRRIAIVMERVARAVQFAHDHGVLHRDLKPSNILVDGDDEPHVLDFGLARRESTDATITEPGTVLGTPRYLAPEQIDSHLGPPGRAADVYGLGAVLYELLTGRPPFDGETSLEVLDRVRRRDPERPRLLDTRVPVDLETICMRCLEKEPRRRYASAGDVADELGSVLAGRPILARPASPPVRLWKLCRRNPLVAGLSAGVVIALLALVVVLWEANRIQRASLRRALIAEARARRSSQRPGQRFQSLEAIRRAARIASDDELAREALASLALADVEESEITPAPPSAGKALAWSASPDGSRFAVGRKSANVVVFDRAGRVECEFPVPRSLGWASLEWSPDGRHLAVTTRNVREIWSISAKPVRRILEADTGRPGFFPGNSTVAVPRSDGSIAVYDLDSGRSLRMIPRAEGIEKISAVYPSPDGSRLAIMGAKPRVVAILDARTGKMLRHIATVHHAAPIQWHPDGERVAFRGNVHDVRLAEVNGRRDLTLLETSDTTLRIRFHPSGRFLAASGWSGITRIVNVASGKLVLEIEGDSIAEFSPDGEALLTWRPRTGFVRWRFEPRRGWLAVCGFGRAINHVQDASFSNGMLATATRAGVYLHDIARSRILTRLLRREAKSVMFTQGGRSLLAWGRFGLRRWRVRAADGDNGPIRIGPVENLGLVPEGRFSRAIVSPDGRNVLAVTGGRKALLAMLETGDRIELDSPVQIGSPTASDEMRWVAAYGSGGFVVWNGTTGEPVYHEKSRPNANAWVSLETRPGALVGWLNDEFRVIETGTWRTVERRRMVFDRIRATAAPGVLAVSALDPSTVLLTDSRQRFHPTSLKTPCSSVNVLRLSPGGRYLAVWGNDNVVFVADLERLGAGLEAAGFEGLLPRGDDPDLPPSVVLER